MGKGIGGPTFLTGVVPAADANVTTETGISRLGCGIFVTLILSGLCKNVFKMASLSNLFPSRMAEI